MELMADAILDKADTLSPLLPLSSLSSFCVPFTDLSATSAVVLAITLPLSVELSGVVVLVGVVWATAADVLFVASVLLSDVVIELSLCVELSGVVMEVSATSANGANRLSMLCEPIEREMAEEMESGLLRGVVVSGDKVRDEARVRQLEDRYGWDVLQSRSIWAFGPDEQGPNMLVDETLPSEVSQHTHAQCTFIQG